MSSKRFQISNVSMILCSSPKRNSIRKNRLYISAMYVNFFNLKFKIDLRNLKCRYIVISKNVLSKLLI